MMPEGVESGVPDVYSKASPGLRTGCSPTRHRALDLLELSPAIGDLPVAGQQLHGFVASLTIFTW